MAGGFFAQALSNIGGALRSEQQYQETDQDIQLNNQKLQMNQMAMQQQKQKQKAETDVGNFMSSQVDADKSLVNNPIQMGQMQQKAATMAFKEGNFQLGKELETDAKVSYQEAKDQVTRMAVEKKQTQEDLSKEAYNFAAGDMNDPAAQRALVDKALAAGVSPMTLPKPGDVVGWATFARKSQTSALTAEQHATLIEKANTASQVNDNQKQLIKDHETEHRDHVRDVAAQREATAVQRGMLAEATASRREESKRKTDFAETEVLNTKLQREAKPYVEDLHKVNTVESLLHVAATSPSDSSRSLADKQLHQALTNLSSEFRTRATADFYKDTKNFGDAAERLTGFISHGFTGQYSDEERQGISNVVKQLKGSTETALRGLEGQQKQKAKGYGLDADHVEIEGEFNRTAPTSTAPATTRATATKAPSGKSPAVVEGTVISNGKGQKLVLKNNQWVPVP